LEQFQIPLQRHLMEKLSTSIWVYLPAREKGHNVPPWFMAAMSSEGDGVIYAIAVVASCTGEAKT